MAIPALSSAAPTAWINTIVWPVVGAGSQMNSLPKKSKPRWSASSPERNWKIDIVLSHTGPLKYEPTEVFLPMIDQSTVDKSTEVWLEQIEAKLDYERWYFAHYHTEKEVGKVRIHA